MLVRIEIDVAGEKQISRAFEATARETEDMTEPLTDVGRLVLRQVGEQFLTEGAHGGTPWQRLSRAYEAWKEENFPGRPLLVRTGDMRRAALSPTAISIGPRRMVYEVDDPKAIYHQRGDGHQPQRRLVQLNPEARRQVDRAFVEWLNAIRRHAMIGTGR